MTVVISSRFAGPREVREPDGRFEAVLPDATPFESLLQESAMEAKLTAAESRALPARPSWIARRRAAKAARVAQAMGSTGVAA